MAVRVRLRIRAAKGARAGKTIETAALVNTGFETDSPELLVPLKLAEAMAFWPELPEATKLEVYDTSGGQAQVHRTPEAADIQVTSMGVESASVRCDISISEIEDEALISDMLASALGIVIEDPGLGLWGLRNRRETFKSEEPTYW